MGNIAIPQFKIKEHRLSISKGDDLEFYMTIQDPLLGFVQIFKHKKRPLQFILKLQRKIQNSRICNIFLQIQNNEPISLISLYGFKIDRHNYCNTFVKESIVSYWEYYNFYLSDYLEKRSLKRCVFVESELWHIIQMCCEGSNQLKKYNCHYDFLPSTMVITPQGKLKLLWAHLKTHNSHIKYNKYFEKYQQNQQSKFQQSFYSPEQLYHIAEKQYSNKVVLEKCNSYSLGMLLLYCVALSNPLVDCYDFNLMKINYKNIDYFLETKVNTIYSNELKTVINSLLIKDPKKRITTEQIYKKYKQLMKDQYELRVCGGNNMQQSKVSNKLKQKQFADISDTKTVKLKYSKPYK